MYLGAKIWETMVDRITQLYFEQKWRGKRDLRLKLSQIYVVRLFVITVEWDWGGASGR